MTGPPRPGILSRVSTEKTFLDPDALRPRSEERQLRDATAVFANGCVEPPHLGQSRRPRNRPPPRLAAKNDKLGPVVVSQTFQHVAHRATPLVYCDVGCRVADIHKKDRRRAMRFSSGNETSQ